MTRTWCALLIAAAVAVPAAAQQKPATFPSYLQGQYAMLKKYIMGSAEKMPAEHFSFRPSPDVRTYAELFGHTMQAQFGYCSTVKGVANPTSGKSSRRSSPTRLG